MAENLLIGLSTMALCIAIQCLFASILLRGLFALETKQVIRPTVVRSSALLTVVLLVLVAGNLVQMAIWAGLFLAYGEFQDYATAFYHSVVNFSTLGYGDVVMSEKRRLVGSLEAVNGVLMFGLTTSILFLILSELMHQAWNHRAFRMAESDPVTLEPGKK